MGRIAYPPPTSVQKITRGIVAAARRRFRPCLETLEDRITPNSAPIAVADSYQVHQGDSLYISDPGVLANDSDADQDTLTAELVSDVSNGYLFLEEDGSFSYDPDPGFAGTDSFDYWAYDGADYSNIVTVTINVTNQAPVAVGETYSVHQGDSLFVSSPGTLGNDSDADQDSLTAELVSDASDGSLTLNDDGSFDYDPNPGFAGTDSFTYRAYDGAAYSNTVTVTINVTNQAPVGEDDYYWTFVNDDLTVSAVNGVLVNDSDPDQDLLTAELYSSTSDGTLDLYSDGSFDYYPDYDFEGTDSFVYRVFDGAVYSGLLTVTLAVQAQPGANERIWEGDFNWQWDIASNWADIDNDNHGDIAGAGHDVVINLTAGNDWYPQIDANALKTVRSIRVNRVVNGQEVINPHNDPSVNVNFSTQKQLKILGTLVLTGAGGSSNWSKGHINFDTTGLLEIKNDFLWRSGEIRSTNGEGVINVYAAPAQVGAKMTIWASSALEAAINIGQDSLGLNEGNGEVELVNMDGNLTIRKNVDINVGRFGVLAFNQGVLQNGAEGGIVRGAANILEQPPYSPNSEINNRGMVSRNDITGRYVQVGIPLINESGGTLYVENRSAVRFDAPHRPYDVLQNDGTISMYFDSELIVPNGGLQVNQGTVTLHSDLLPTANIEINGNITLFGGVLNVGDVQGKYVHLTTNILTVYGGTIKMSIDGSSANQNDKITATTFAIQPILGATLDIDVDGALNANLSWDVIDYGSKIGTDFTAYDFDGQALTAAFDNANTLLRISS